jgi:Na+/proline symporter
MTIGLAGWLVILLVPVGALILGFFRRSTATNYVDYCLARRSLNDRNFLAAFFGANLVFTAIFLVISYETARRGWWAASVPIGFALGVALLYAMYPRLEKHFKEGKTLHEALAGAYGATRIRRLCALWTIVAFVGMVSIEFYGGILLLKWCKLPILFSIVVGFILATICSAFTVRGGLRGLTVVDIFLDAISCAGILVFGYFLVGDGAWNALMMQPVAHAASMHGPPPLSDNLTFAFAALVLFVPMPICALDTWQRGVAWKRQDKKVGAMLTFGAFAICVVTIAAMLAGSYAVLRGWAFDDFYPFRYTLQKIDVLEWPWSWLKGLIVAGFIAAIFSTADELLNCAAFAMLSDVYLLPPGEDAETRHRNLRSVKVYTGMFAYVAALLASVYAVVENNSNLRIQDFFYAVASTQVVFFVPLMAALYSKHVLPLHERLAFWSMVAGFATAFCSGIIGGFLLQGESGRALLDGAPLLAFFASAVTFGLGHARIALRERRQAA